MLRMTFSNDGLIGDHLAISGGLLQAPLNPLKADVSRGLPGLSGGPGPLGPTVIRPLQTVNKLITGSQ